ncbi:AAA family ATPase [Flectobacillus rivi]|uniref:ATP-binding protein n=1 Tax=Flectobacillus rivi TaxID=2984209 RepID=A0ABT6Z4B5_9BACT|nr:ATP-binding protein [Flectobacillus rivi]MDI9875975.1 ATP-binding protein [Flectobacillus rivi]
MIQEFSVKNFLSFREKQTISFLASTDKKNVNEVTFQPREGVKILKLLMVYGANASGKTNLILAIQALWVLMISSQANEDEKISQYRPFILDEGEPTEFEIIFWKGSIKYKYHVVFDESRILYERLMYTTESGILSDLYERSQKETIKFGSTIRELKAKDKQVFNTETLKNHTVLATLNKKNIQSPSVLVDLYIWIKNNVHGIGSYQNAYEIAELANRDKGVKNFLLEILKKADFNISDVHLVETTLSPQLITEIEKDVNVSNELKAKLLKPQKEILFFHNSDEKAFSIPYRMESAGTKAYFRLARLLLELGNEGTLVMEDELEDSLHYDLLLHFLETFLRTEIESQLIFATHSQMLLSEEWMLRRDMIVLVEKSKNSSSLLYKASDFGLHKNVSLLNAYKIGKLGAKPILGSTFINES